MLAQLYVSDAFITILISWAMYNKKRFKSMIGCRSRYGSKTVERSGRSRRTWATQRPLNTAHVPNIVAVPIIDVEAPSVSKTLRPAAVCIKVRRRSSAIRRVIRWRSLWPARRQLFSFPASSSAVRRRSPPQRPPSLRSLTIPRFAFRRRPSPTAAAMRFRLLPWRHFARRHYFRYPDAMTSHNDGKLPQVRQLTK